MQRNIFMVFAAIVDANGTFSTLSGYPKTFDSKNYGNDIEKARQRAMGDYHEVLAGMCKVDSRQEQLAMVIDVSNGVQIALTKMGDIADLPDEVSG